MEPTTDNEKKILFADEHGNSIIVDGNGIYLSGKTSLIKPKRLFTIGAEARMLLVNREAFQVYKRFYYEFNHTLLKITHDYDTLRITCPEGTFDVPIKEILDKGEVLIEVGGIGTPIYYQIADMKLHPAKPQQA